MIPTEMLVSSEVAVKSFAFHEDVSKTCIQESTSFVHKSQYSHFLFIFLFF